MKEKTDLEISDAGSGDTDDLLLVAMAARDESALGVFYHRHSALVLTVCRRIVGNHTDAEQLLLDAFWEFWQRAGDYDSQRASPRSYLLLIARSRALDFVRRRKSRIQPAAGNSVRTAVSQGSAEPTLVGPKRADPGPLTKSIDSERAAIVREALASLDPEQRRAIESAYYDGCTHVEIAARLGLPLGTLKTRMRQALSTLRLRLRKICDEPIVSSAIGKSRATASEGIAQQQALVEDDV